VLPLVYPHRWRAAGIFLLVSILVLALIPGLWFWPISPDIAWKASDKWLHGMTFALLAVWFSGQYARRAYWRFVLGLLMYGALIEACQYLLPYRKAEIGDLMADIAGIAFGVLLASLGAGGWSMRFERWMRG
jgi:hypothetical protein